ncbi:MAG: hypothetical protein RL479_1845, partial [Verrucomicrobiota bacterium]
MNSRQAPRTGRGRTAAILSLLLSAAELAGDPLRIATWNVANYGPTGRVTAAGYRSDYPKPEAEKAALRAALHRLDADVLALQEMGPPAYLEELARDLAREGLHYPYRAIAGDGEPRRNALLSRRPLHA